MSAPLRRALLLALALIAAAGLAPPAHAAPYLPFTWTVADGFTDADGNGRLNEANDEPTVVNTTVPVDLDGCGIAISYTTIEWQIDGKTVPGTNCSIKAVPVKANTPHLVVERVTTSSGVLVRRHNVNVRNYLVVGLGDSAASGEGNPERDQQLRCALGACVVDAGPAWADGADGRRCHRSTKAGQGQAAVTLEKISPKTSVTFVHLACSGASLVNGLTGPYEGIEPSNPLLPSQVDQLDRLTCTKASYPLGPCPTSHRPVDLLMVSIGINDIGFDDIVQTCFYTACNTPEVAKAISDNLVTLRTNLLGLPSTFYNHGIDPAKVVFQAYPLGLRDESGGFARVPGLLGGVGPLGIMPSEASFLESSMLVPLNATLVSAVGGMGRSNWSVATAIAGDFLPHGVAADSCPVPVAERDVRWSDPCSGASRNYNRFIETYEDSRWIQGPWCAPTCLGDSLPLGTVHPNLSGHAAIAARLVAAVRSPSPILRFDGPPRVTDVGDGDGALEPGEGFKLVAPLKNTGGTGSAAATFMYEDPAVTVTQPTASYPPIATGTSADGGPLAGTIDRAAACGSDVQVVLEATSNPGWDFDTTTRADVFSLHLGAPAAQPEAASSAARPIPAGGEAENEKTGAVTVFYGKAESTVNVPATGAVYDVAVRIGEIRHPMIGGLTIKLVAPDGTTATVYNHSASAAGATDVLNARFAESGASPLDVPAPMTGTWSAPDLARFHGVRATGTWKLQIENGWEEAGTLKTWGLQIRTAVCNA